MVTWGRQRPRRFVFAVGLYTIGYALYDFIYPAIAQNIRDPHDLPKRYGKGSWVVVTGANNTIGQEFVKVMNQKGFNVVMVDENEEEL